MSDIATLSVGNDIMYISKLIKELIVNVPTVPIKVVITKNTE